jgi:hypothetical protein
MVAPSTVLQFVLGLLLSCIRIEQPPYQCFKSFKYFNKCQYYQLDTDKVRMSGRTTGFRNDAKNEAFEKGLWRREGWEKVGRGGPQACGCVMQAREH